MLRTPEGAGAPLGVALGDGSQNAMVFPSFWTLQQGTSPASASFPIRGRTRSPTQTLSPGDEPPAAAASGDGTVMEIQAEQAPAPAKLVPR